MDLQILAALSDRARYNSLIGMVPEQMIEPDTAVMLQWYKAYFTAFPEQKRVDPDELTTLVNLRSKNSTAEQKATTLYLVSKLRKPVPDDVVQGIVAQLYELDFVGRAGSVLARYNENGEVDASYELQMMAAATRRAIAGGQKANWADGDILHYLEQESDEGGLQWDIFDILKEALRGLQIGDNVAVCAPTDQGKSSLLCKLAVLFQRQAKVLYPGRPTLYLVNEGTEGRIKTRLYGTAAGLERDALLVAARDGSLQKTFALQMGGLDMIRSVNIHGKNMAQVSRIIEQHNPHLVISDMTGRIRATSNKSGGANDINQLEEVWNDMRELAVLQEFAHIGTVQVSAEGFNQLYPPVSALQNSKTGIQTTLDLILMMGALTNPDSRDLRGLSTPKNKLARSGKKSLSLFQANFDAGPNIWDTYAQ